MLPTVRSGDLVLETIRFYTIESGDIISFKPDGRDVYYIKRVIATEGDIVDFDFSKGIVYVNGTAIEESYTKSPTYERGDTEFPMTIKPGRVFVLGDNRNASTDSRFSIVGQVRTDRVAGKIILIIPTSLLTQK